MNTTQNKRYHLLLKECGMTEDETDVLVWAISGDRTTSSKELNPTEVKALLDYLQKKHSGMCKKMRGKIIHYLCLLGYTTGKDKADYDRIDAFIVDMGSNNPRRVILNYLYYSELPAVVNQVEAMYRNESKRVTKK